MEAILAVLPELDPIGSEAISAPEWRQRNLAALVLPLEPAHSLLEHVSTLDLLALARGPGAKLTAARTCPEVLRRLLLAHALDAAFEANLPAQGLPVEDERGPRVRLEVATFPAFVVCVEDEAVIVDSVQENDPGRGSSVRIRGRQSHGLGHRQAKSPSLVEPCSELLHRVVREVFFANANHVGHGASLNLADAI